MHCVRYDHVAVGTGTEVNKTAIKQYQQATRDRSAVKTAGGKIIRVEAHPIPEHPRPRRCKGRVALVGDAAGYVTKCSGVCLRLCLGVPGMTGTSCCAIWRLVQDWPA